MESDPDIYKATSIDVIDISNNISIVARSGFDHNSEVALQFSITGKMKTGIKVTNPGNAAFKYVLKDEQGNTLTTKTIY